MKPARTASRWTRLAMAVAFGFMSLGHGPVMTFAHTAKNETAAAAHHHHAAAHEHHAPDTGEAAQAPDKSQTCNAFGCFVTVGAISIDPPTQAMTPIGKLLPPMAPASLPVDTEPTDPPPRLRG